MVMYNMNQYRYHNISKNNGSKLKKTSYQLGVVLILLLVLMLFKYTKNETGAILNEKIRGVFYTDFTEKAQSVFNSTFPALNNLLKKPVEVDNSLENGNEDFVLESLPVNGEITSAFGTRIHPVTNKSETHTGVDIAVAEGTEVKAVYDGTVEEVKDDDELGIVVVISHDNGFKTIYGHLSELKVDKGDKVARDSIIALSGSTGISTGPHLHFEVLFNDESIDPATLLRTITDWGMYEF